MVPKRPDPPVGGGTVLPPQWALLLADLLIIVNYVVALVVPWVEAEYQVNNPWVPIFLPVELGLLRCFSDICKIGKDSNSQQQHMPTWGPPGGPNGGGLNQGGGGGGEKVLFQVSAIFAVILLSASLLLALSGGALEIRRLQGRPITPRAGQLSLQITFLGSILVIVTVLEYLFITVSGLHGGHYEVGFWMSLCTGIVAGLLTFVQLAVNQKYDSEPEYQSLVAHFGGIQNPGTYPTAAFKPQAMQGPHGILVSPVPNTASLR